MKTTSWMTNGVVMKFLTLAAALAMVMSTRAQGTNLTELFQAGLFAEQGDHNLDAAIADYQTLATQYDKDRQLAATAIFRLGECYRAQNRTNEAAAQYHRILKDFADQKVLATMSEQNLKGLGIGVEAPPQQFQQRLQAIIKRSGTDEPTVLSVPTPQDVQELQMVKRVQQMSFPDIIQQAPTLIRDDTLNNLINYYNHNELDLMQLKTNYGPESSQIKSAAEIRDGLKEKIQERLEGLKQALTTALAGSHVDNGPGQPMQSPALAVSNNEDQEIQRIQDLIQNSPDLINRPDSDGHTPLVVAAQKGWLKVAGYLLDHGAEVNPQDHSTTPLYAAADVGNRTMVEFLLKHGAQPNAISVSGDTALMQAVKKGYAAVIKVLLANGADVNAGNPDNNNTPLIESAVGPLNIVQSLLEAGAAVNVENKAGKTPLNLAVQRGLPETIKLLLDAKASVNTVADDGGTPLCYAARMRDSNVASMLLAAGADPNLQDNNGRTALSYAAELAKVDCVSVLLAAKADPNGGKNTLPLQAAVGAKDLQSARLLLEAGADPNQFKRFGMSLHTAIDADFMGHQENMTALWLAVWLEQPEMVRLLAEHKADLGDSSDYGYSILFPTLSHTNLLTILLDAGGDPNARYKNDSDNRTLLQTAANSGLIPAIDILLKHSADPNLLDANGDTALHIALYLTSRWPNGTNIVVSLLDHGANPNVRNHQGRTPLLIARDSRNEMFTVLLRDLLHQHGALDKLPDWDRIEVSRTDVNFLEPIFFKGTNNWNHFTLCETLLNCYDNRGPRFAPILGMGVAQPINNQFPYGPQFPDFSRITVIRPHHDSTNETRITVNLLNDAGEVDGTKDITLQFGDVVEIPERDHALGESFTGLSQAEKDGLAAHLRGHVSLMVKGKPTSIEIYPEPQWALLKKILADNTARSVLLASSDLSRITVTRRDKESGKEMTWTIDCIGGQPASPGNSTFQQRLNRIIQAGQSGFPPATAQITGDQEMADDIWLRDGDVINVPEKP